MSILSQQALQAALYSRLSGDSALMALVTGIHDFVPANAAYPYVTIGDMSGEDASTRSAGGMRYSVTLRIYSREAGRKQTSQIMERMHALLHLASFLVAGHALVMMRMEGSDLTLGNDGLTYQGSMRFRTVTEAL